MGALSKQIGVRGGQHRRIFVQYRFLGKTGLRVSEIAHGTWAMGSMWGRRDDDVAKRALRLSLERGVNFFDTASVYGHGHAERILGQVLGETSGGAWVATKVAPQIDSWPPRPGTLAREAFSYDHIIRSTEQSLKNLRLETIDLQQLHVWRPEWLVAEEEWLEAVSILKAQGKIRFFGVSLNDHEADSGLELVKSGWVDTIQVIFNLFDQSPREKLFPLCEQYQVGVLVRVPLDEGGLTGTLTTETRFTSKDWRSRYFWGDRLRETVARVEALDFLTKSPYRSMAQAALKFCLTERAVSTVLVGMRQEGHVWDNTEVPHLPEFSPEIVARCHEAAWPRNFYPKIGWV